MNQLEPFVRRHSWQRRSDRGFSTAVRVSRAELDAAAARRNRARINGANLSRSSGPGGRDAPIGQAALFNRQKIQFHLLSFEGPKGYSRTGGIASRIDGLARALAVQGARRWLGAVELGGRHAMAPARREDNGRASNLG